MKTDPNLHPAAVQGIQLYNQGEFYEAHEPLELAWMETEAPERDLYQGILQIGLAYFQIQRGNYRGALKMFRRGQKNLKALPPALLGIDIEGLRSDARQVETSLRAAGASSIQTFDPSTFPPLRLLPPG